MRHYRAPLVALGFVFAAAVPVQADDAASPRAVVDRAVKAHGGQDALAKLPAVTVAFRGKFHGMGEAIDMTGEVATHGADRIKIDVEIDAGGQKFRFVSVLNGDEGWVRLGDATTTMDKDQLTEAREEAHSGWVATLAPLADKAYTLELVGETKVDDRPAVGVRVSRKGRRDVNLYFDKETGLLAKVESRVKDEMSGQEVTEETLPSDYKNVQGTRQAMKFTVKRDGKLFMQGEATDVTLAEKHDPGVYAKP